MRVLLTGAAGYFGRTLLPAFLADPRISHILATDRVPPPPGFGAQEGRLDWQILDLARASAAHWGPLLAQRDVVVHLAFDLLPRPGQDTRASNRSGQSVLLEAAAKMVPRIVVTSAAAAYGFAEERDPNEGLLDESHPLGDSRDLPYAESKQAMEHHLDELEARHNVTIVRARPTNVAGPTIDPRRIAHLRSRWHLAPKVDHPIRQQLLHEDDLASAFLILLDAPAGAYNIAPDDWLILGEAAARMGQRLVALRPSWLRTIAGIAWRMGASVYDADWLGFLEHPPIILSNRKLRSLGWEPRHSTGETLQSLRG